MKSVLRGMIIFFITFVIGSLFASLYFSRKENSVKPQKFSNNINRIKSSNPPQCENPVIKLIQMRFELLKEWLDLKDWLENNKNNKDISKKQRAEIKKKLLSKEKQIEEIKSQIEDWKLWNQFRKENPVDGQLAVKLLHKEPCYNF